MVCSNLDFAIFDWRVVGNSRKNRHNQTRRPYRKIFPFFDGTVHPKKIAQVSSLSGGQITQVGVQLGDWVYENQKLIEIDHSRSLLAKKLSENELNIAQQNLKLATKVFERIHKMHSDSLISEEVYEKAEYEAFAS